jgi:hypothetical protein
MPENAEITFIPPSIPEGLCFTTTQELLNYLAFNLRGFLPGNFSSWNTGASEPTVENRDKAWDKVFADGRPDRVYHYYNGKWVAPHWAPASGKMLVQWTGTPTELETYDGGTPGTISDTTGPFWTIDANWADRIPMGVGPIAALNTNVSKITAATGINVRGVYWIVRTARIFYVA